MEERTTGIVTPEAVLLQFETANVASRGLARALDLVIQFTAFFALAMVLSIGAAVGGGGDEVSAVFVAAISVLGFLLLVGYPIGFEALWAGRTPGKAMLGLRVVTRDGAPVRFRHTAIRGIISSVDVFLLTFVSVLSCAVSRRHQRPGDLFAGTIVIRERAAQTVAVALTFPPPAGFEGYVRQLDVSAMTPGQYQVVRSFLMRVFQLTPEARSRIAVRLANPLATALHHVPPAGLGPEQWLVCAAAAYQQRHGGQAALPPPPVAAGGWGPPGFHGGAPGRPSHLLPPPAGFGPPPAGFGSPPPGYAQPPAGYPQPPAGYGPGRGYGPAPGR